MTERSIETGLVQEAIDDALKQVITQLTKNAMDGTMKVDLVRNNIRAARIAWRSLSEEFRK